MGLENGITVRAKTQLAVDEAENLRFPSHTRQKKLVLL